MLYCWPGCFLLAGLAAVAAAAERLEVGLVVAAALNPGHDMVTGQRVRLVAWSLPAMDTLRMLTNPATRQLAPGPAESSLTRRGLRSPVWSMTVAVVTATNKRTAYNARSSERHCSGAGNTSNARLGKRSHSAYNDRQLDSSSDRSRSDAVAVASSVCRCGPLGCPSRARCAFKRYRQHRRKGCSTRVAQWGRN